MKKTKFTEEQNLFAREAQSVRPYERHVGQTGAAAVQQDFFARATQFRQSRRKCGKV
jgi:hypothetical protein